MNENVSLTVVIMDKEYCIACPAEEKEALLKSANMLNHQIDRLLHSGKVVGNERLAVMAALNIASELVELRKNGAQQSRQLQQRLQLLHDRLEQALARDTELFIVG